MKHTQYFPAWPEWNDNDLNNEKWDSHGYGSIKRDSNCFEDPDGSDWFPPVLGAASWKRPSETIHPKLLCVVDNQSADFDLISLNKHLIHNELMRLIISQIISLVNLSSRKTQLLPEPISNVFIPPDNTVWKPWHHVYSLCKAGKIPHQPFYNPWGKYVVRLHWMGCWRKIYVDDYIPTALDGRWLLPLSSKAQELWPAILVKALLKVASLEFHLSDPRDFSAIEHLTGWMPEKIIHYRHYQAKFWEILLTCCPKYEWPLQGENGKESTKRSLLKSQCEQPSVEHNQACVAAFADLYTYSDNMSKQSQKMNAVLQTLNFSNKLRHALYVSEVRTIPLQAPQSYDEIPTWKLIRRHLWDESYMLNINKQIKCLGLFIPWGVSEIIDDGKKEVGPREREFSTVRNPIVSYRLKRDIRKDVSKYCETIQVQWINFEDFCKCFRSIFVFHKLSAYAYCYKLMDMKIAQRKISTKSLTTSMGGHHVQCINDGIPFYLFSESLERTEIFISFSVCGILSNRMVQNPARYDSFTSIYSFDEKPQHGVDKGYLVVESFDWQRQRPIQVILTLKSAASKGSLLILPPGRHVLAITTRSAFGSFITICSNSQLVVGEDDVIFPKITSESLRFVAESENILSLLIECFTSFGNTAKLLDCEEQLYSAVCPNNMDKHNGIHYSAFKEAVFILIARVLDSTKLPADVAFALRVFTLLPYIFEINESKLNVYMGKRIYAEESNIAVGEISTKQQILKRYESWYTVRRIIKLQSFIRRFLVRNVIRGRIKVGNKFQKRASEQLSKFANLIQKQPHDNAIYLLRSYFHLAPSVVQQFPFYTDECSSVLSYEYTGISNYIPSTNAWLIVFRDVFHVLENRVKITPCFHCNDVIWSQHVMDNDRLQQTPETILKTYQSEYKRNKYGYAILLRICNVEAQKDVKWTLRLVSPLGSLYAPSSKDSSSSIAVVKDVEDYYCPKKKNIIARYSIQSLRECVITIQFAVSSPRVRLEINIFEEDSIKLLTVRGKSEIIIPAVVLRKYNKYDETTSTNYIEVKVLHDSWLVDPVHIPFIQALQQKDQLEIHLGLRTSDENININNTTDLQETVSSFDHKRPFWLLKIIAENNLADSIIIQKDTRRVEEIRAIKRRWENKLPGRFTKAYNSRAVFLQKYGIDSMPSSFNWPSTGRSSIISDKLGSWVVCDEMSDMSFLQQPTKTLPEPINTKVRLKTWNIANFVRRLRPKDNQTLKDKSLALLQSMVQKKINENYNMWRNSVKAESEHMKAQQQFEKCLLNDSHKQWQKRMNDKRKHIMENREECRVNLLEQEELNELAFMKCVEEIQAKTADIRKDVKKK